MSDNGDRDDTANMRCDYRSPREGLDFTGHWPDLSAKHADAAIMSMIRANGENDSRQREFEMQQAQVFATLSLRDKVDELNATLGEIARFYQLASSLKRVA